MLKNTLTILTILVLLQSCGLPYCKKVKFDNDDLLWLEAYEKGDTIVFKSDFGKFDTILITAKDVYNPKNTFIFDLRGCNCWEGDNEFNAIAGFDFIFTNISLRQDNSNKSDGLFGIEKISKDKPAFQSFAFCELYSREIILFKDTTIFVENDKLSDCIVLHRNQCGKGHNKPKLIIEKFIWSKRLGLVQYVTETGEKFEYFKKIPAAKARIN